MSSIVGVRNVPCKPFKSNTISVELKNGIARPKQTTELVELETVFAAVMFDAGWPEPCQVPAGSKVFVSAKHSVLDWAKTVYTVVNDGVEHEIILVPTSVILMIGE